MSDPQPGRRGPVIVDTGGFVDLELDADRLACWQSGRTRRAPARDHLAGLADRPPIVIHAMPLRRTFYDLLPTGEDDR